MFKVQNTNFHEPYQTLEKIVCFYCLSFIIIYIMLKFRGFSIISRRYVAEATEMIIGQPVDEDGHLWSLTDHPLVLQ